jgi:HrpA-like RNA helicase
MSDTLGKGVGYQIRMEAKKSTHTRLLFCTTGIVLRRLQDDPNLEGVTHVLVDEVHERQQQTDVLLIILRQLLNTTRRDIKVILMSATLDSELFCSFFNGAPLISVPGRTFPVQNYFLEDILEATNHVIEEGSRYAKFECSYTEQTSLHVTQRGGSKRKEMVDLTSSTNPVEVSSLYESYSMSTRRSMERVNEDVINFDLLEDLLILLVGDRKSEKFGIDLSTGSILVFLPGLGETLFDLRYNWWGFNLHSDSLKYQQVKSSQCLNAWKAIDISIAISLRLFQCIPPSPLGTKEGPLFQANCARSVSPFYSSFIHAVTVLFVCFLNVDCLLVLSTNISETSVTIPDVVCVIDTGKVKELRRSNRFLTYQLVTDWCSRASAKQRAGRAGRVQEGLCLKLYSSHTANNVMKHTSLPELQRVPLEEICLSVMASGYTTKTQTCSDFLSQAPQPPSVESIKSALTVLRDVGALEVDNLQCESLSPLGRHLAKIPVNVRLGKMLLFGCLFNCIDPILTVASSLSSQSPFSTFLRDQAVAKAKQQTFADSDSDFVTYINVFDAYNQARRTSPSAGSMFCRENYLNEVSLREIANARKQFIGLLCGIGFLGPYESADEETLKLSSFNKQSRKTELVHAVICAGLYPNIARLDQTVASSEYSLWHKEESIYFHGSSVNASKKRYLSTQKWAVFDEKFGTTKRTSVSTTAFVHPLALVLFGGNVVVKHTDRLVIVDQWIELNMSAQTGCILKEIKKTVDDVLRKMIECTNDIGDLEAGVIDGLCKILMAM